MTRLSGFPGRPNRKPRQSAHGTPRAMEDSMTNSNYQATVTVRANADLDDCLTGAVDEYIAEHPELSGYDLTPRWTDESDRSTVDLTVPVWALDGAS